MVRAGELHADGYHLLGCDLRCVAEVRRQLAAAGVTADAPTLALAECVLVYLRPDAARALLQHLAATYPRLVLLVYEQCNLGDKFGEVSEGARGRPPPGGGRHRSASVGPQVMVRNLSARGCMLAGLADAGAAAGGGAVALGGAAGSPDQQAERLRALGYDHARGWDMDAVWRALPEDDRARVEALEMLDERELLQQLHVHYAITVATRGDLFADIDLNA